MGSDAAAALGGSVLIAVAWLILFTCVVGMFFRLGRIRDQAKKQTDLLKGIQAQLTTLVEVSGESKLQTASLSAMNSNLAKLVATISPKADSSGTKSAAAILDSLDRQA